MQVRDRGEIWDSDMHRLAYSPVYGVLRQEGALLDLRWKAEQIPEVSSHPALVVEVQNRWFRAGDRCGNRGIGVNSVED